MKKFLYIRFKILYLTEKGMVTLNSVSIPFLLSDVKYSSCNTLAKDIGAKG
ncbi:hypothetical protein JMF89_09515 [Clostridiaceae bacterium UIB06]|nr:hypothetical protein [Clostridiaceae bacterium UIB06]